MEAAINPFGFIQIETREGGRVSENLLPFGDAELADAFAALDGRRTTVFTVPHPDGILFVGGGHGIYTVTTLMGNGSCFALAGNPEAMGEIEIILGGVWTPQPLRYVVRRGPALQAARHFMQTGQMTSQQEWESHKRVDRYGALSGEPGSAGWPETYASRVSLAPPGACPPDGEPDDPEHRQDEQRYEASGK